MKHSLSITAILLLLFVAAQVIGISLLSLNIKSIETTNGTTTVSHDTTALGERPQTVGAGSLLYLLVGVAIGTILILILIKLKAFTIWKIWFLLAVWFSTTIALGVLLPQTVALIICLALAIWKVFKPNPIIHNITEVFMYAGIAVLLAPIFTLLWIIILLLIISVYDIIAVWYSKHMVVMANAQTEGKLFAGLYIPKNDDDSDKEKLAGKQSEKYVIDEPPKPHYTHTARAHTTTVAQKRTATTDSRENTKTTQKKNLENTPEKENNAPKKQSAAILGGGDIAFPLLFSGVLMDWLITNGATKTTALFETLIITACVTTALTMLFIYAKKDKFYPAMPFLTAGCLVGLSIVALVM